MIAGLSLGTELSRFKRSRMSRIALVTIIVMPLLYSALYLWAFWDPFTKTSDMPIAVVNNDRGATVDGKRLDAGDRIAAKLAENPQLDWRVVSADEAADGVEHGRYYFSVEITPGFSEAVASPSGPAPHQANLLVTYNQNGNYLSSLIGRTAMETLQNTVSGEIAGQSVDKVLVGLQTAGDGVRRAAAGAKQLDAGAHDLQDGAAELSGGIDRAHDGAQKLSAGIDRAHAGAGQLDAGISRLTDGLGRLGAGAGQVADGVDQIVRRLDDLAATQQASLTPLRQLADQLRGSPDPAAREVAARLDALRSDLSARTQDGALGDLHRLRDGSRQVATQLSNPSADLLGGVGRLVDSVHQLNTGLGQLSDGGHELGNGLGQLSDGGHRLRDGTGRLVAGTGELSAGLTAGAEKAPAWDGQQRQKMATTMGAPVALSAVYDNPAPTFGYGFAPFFVPLALFVGGIIIWMLLKPMQTRALATRLHPLRVVLASYWPAFLIGLGQAAIIFLVLRFGLGMTPVHPAAAVTVIMAISVCFIAIIQMLNAVFGPSVGRVLSMAVLMFQLVSSGGIYPPETQPRFFQVLHPLNPMTYGITALRQAVMGGVDGRFLRDVGVVLFVTVIALAISAWAAWRDRVWNIDRLHPPVQV